MGTATKLNEQTMFCGCPKSSKFWRCLSSNVSRQGKRKNHTEPQRTQRFSQASALCEVVLGRWIPANSVQRSKGPWSKIFARTPNGGLRIQLTERQSVAASYFSGWTLSQLSGWLKSCCALSPRQTDVSSKSVHNPIKQPFLFFELLAPSQAVKFNFELCPVDLFEYCQNELPFGCHAWNRYDRDFSIPPTNLFGLGARKSSTLAKYQRLMSLGTNIGRLQENSVIEKTNWRQTKEQPI